VAITVNPVTNHPPVIAQIANQVATEGVKLVVAVTAKDPDPGEALRFGLGTGAPAGAVVNATTGVFTWTPTEAQGPGNYSVTVRVTDRGGLSDTQTFGIRVNEDSTINAGPEAGDHHRDTFDVVRVGGNLQVSVNGTLAYTTPFATAPLLTIQGSTDNDTLVLDFSGGNPIPATGIRYDGGGPGDHDLLRLAHGRVHRIVHTATGPGSGTLRVDGALLTYTGLEPIEDDLSVDSREFEFGDGPDNITVTMSPATTEVSSPSSETVTFANPTESLTILAGGGDDVIRVVTTEPLTPNFAIVLDGGPGHNSIQYSAGVKGHIIERGETEASRYSERGGPITSSLNGAISTLQGVSSLEGAGLGGNEAIKLYPEGLAMATLPMTTSASAVTTVFQTGRNYLDPSAFDRYRSQLNEGDDGGQGLDGTVTGTAPRITSLTSSASRVGGALERQNIVLTGAFASSEMPDIRTATIAWGDDEVEPATLVEGNGGWTVSGHHAYEAGGIYDITLSVTTEEGAVARRATKARITGAGINERVLQIVGTSGKDAVDLKIGGKDGELIEVTADFLPDDGHARTFTAADFDVIVIVSGGDGRVEIDDRITKPVVTDGTGRNDFPGGGGPGSAMLNGGPRTDDLLGGRKRGLRQAEQGNSEPTGRRGIGESEQETAPKRVINWAGSYSGAPKASGISSRAQDSSPRFVDFVIPETLAGDAKSAPGEYGLPLTVLTLDWMGKLIGPQPGNGSGQKKNGKNSGKSRR
jgi:hypothetical protein